MRDAASSRLGIPPQGGFKYACRRALCLPATRTIDQDLPILGGENHKAQNPSIISGVSPSRSVRVIEPSGLTVIERCTFADEC